MLLRFPVAIVLAGIGCGILQTGSLATAGVLFVAILAVASVLPRVAGAAATLLLRGIAPLLLRVGLRVRVAYVGLTSLRWVSLELPVLDGRHGTTPALVTATRVGWWPVLLSSGKWGVELTVLNPEIHMTMHQGA